MVVLVAIYLAVAYWHFRMTLRHCQTYDTADTVVLNATIALLFGPFFVLAVLCLIAYERTSDAR